MSDAALQAHILEARGRTVAWLDEMTDPDGVTRFSPRHDAERWPGMLLPGSYNAVMCRALLGAPLPGEALIRWFEAHRISDGRFRLLGMEDDAVHKKPEKSDTWEYIDFHATNYALGAIEALAPERPPILEFIRPYLDAQRLAHWLARRHWNDPWQEGNNLVNLASFLLLAERGGTDAATERLTQILAHLEEIQSPATGFWGERQDEGGAHLLHAMAGAMHIFHLWYIRSRPLPHFHAAIDYTLTLPADRDMGACIDVDAVDLLYHGALLTGHRTAEIERWLRKRLDLLLSAQRPNGGFADQEVGELRFDGWVGGYSEPQGGSNTFATWFRWIAIAMIAQRLWPGWRDWHFRRMIGIGYARVD
jgi:hypothetical protein